MPLMSMDEAFLPSKGLGDIQIYEATTGVNTQGFQIWRKPLSAKMVYMIVIGGGAGGGGGFTRAINTAGGGGAGGACSGISRFLIPAALLPDILYVQVGAGGQGGAASTNGSAGLNSYVLTSKTAVLPNIICYSGVNAPGGGGAGAVGAAGTGGTIPTIAVTQPWNALGWWFTQVGIGGGNGGAQTGAVGTSITAWAALPLSPGAGGAGCTTTDFAGGAQTATALYDLGNQGYYTTTAGNVAAAGTAAGTGVNGSSGIKKITPFLSCGGAGGGSNNAGVAGNGGNGGYGSGGGGGGAGTTGGRGGNGGSGLVIIISY